MSRFNIAARAFGGEGRWPMALPNGHLAAVLLSFVTTAGLFYVNIMPALLSGMVDGLGLTPAMAGYVVSANVYGASVGAFTAVFLVKKLRWKPVAALALLGLMAFDLVSMWQTSGTVLMAIRFAHGMTGGFLVGIGFSVIARTPVPDRTFGMLLIVQYGLGGVGLMTLPKLVPVFGAPVLFFALIAFSFVTLCMLPFLATYPPREETALTVEHGNGSKALFWPLVLAFAAVFCFQAANMGLAAYVIELGRSYGLSTDSISTTLGIANWVAISGAVMVYSIGLARGRWRPLVVGLSATLVGMALFKASSLSLAFFAANVITGITWAFLIPYLLGMCASFDTRGQMAALSGFFSKMGLASGPFIAASLLGDGNFDSIIVMGLVGILLCGAAAFVPARLLDAKAAAPINSSVERKPNQ